MLFVFLLSLPFTLYSMSFFDLLLAAVLLYGFIQGFRQGLFTAFASLISLVIGIILAIKFSHLVRSVIENHVSWNPKYIEVTAFGLTFILVVVGIILLAKLFTGIASFAQMGWLNTIAGGVFGILKMALILSILLNLFQKININNYFLSQETMDKSLFYNPIQETSKMIFPSIQEWYEAFKTTDADKETSSAP